MTFARRMWNRSKRHSEQRCYFVLQLTRDEHTRKRHLMRQCVSDGSLETVEIVPFPKLPTEISARLALSTCSSKSWVAIVIFSTPNLEDAWGTKTRFFSVARTFVGDPATSSSEAWGSNLPRKARLRAGLGHGGDGDESPTALRLT